MKGLAADPDKRWSQVLPMIQQFREVQSRMKAPDSDPAKVAPAVVVSES
jgi:hypothetical protein